MRGLKTLSTVNPPRRYQAGWLATRPSPGQRAEWRSGTRGMYPLTLGRAFTGTRWTPTALSRSLAWATTRLPWSGRLPVYAYRNRPSKRRRARSWPPLWPLSIEAATPDPPPDVLAMPTPGWDAMGTPRAEAWPAMGTEGLLLPWPEQATDVPVAPVGRLPAAAVWSAQIAARRQTPLAGGVTSMGGRPGVVVVRTEQAAARRYALLSRVVPQLSRAPRTTRYEPEVGGLPVAQAIAAERAEPTPWATGSRADRPALAPPFATVGAMTPRRRGPGEASQAIVARLSRSSSLSIAETATARLAMGLRSAASPGLLRAAPARQFARRPVSLDWPLAAQTAAPQPGSPPVPSEGGGGARADLNAAGAAEVVEHEAGRAPLVRAPWLALPGAAELLAARAATIAPLDPGSMTSDAAWLSGATAGSRPGVGEKPPLPAPPPRPGSARIAPWLSRRLTGAAMTRPGPVAPGFGATAQAATTMTTAYRGLRRQAVAARGMGHEVSRSADAASVGSEPDSVWPDSAWLDALTRPEAGPIATREQQSWAGPAWLTAPPAADWPRPLAPVYLSYGARATRRRARTSVMDLGRAVMLRALGEPDAAPRYLSPRPTAAPAGDWPAPPLTPPLARPGLRPLARPIALAAPVAAAERPAYWETAGRQTLAPASNLPIFRSAVPRLAREMGALAVLGAARGRAPDMDWGASSALLPPPPTFARPARRAAPPDLARDAGVRQVAGTERATPSSGEADAGAGEGRRPPAAPGAAHIDWPFLGLLAELERPTGPASAAMRFLRHLSRGRPRPILAQLGSLASLGPGEALAPTIGQAMETLLGRPLSGVRLYTSPIAAELGAEAFTTGQRVVFAPGRMQLRTPQGLGLLAHELSHVGQPLGFQLSTPGASAPDEEERLATQQGEMVQRIIERGWPEAPTREVRRAARTLGALTQPAVPAASAVPLAAPGAVPTNGGLAGLTVQREGSGTGTAQATVSETPSAPEPAGPAGPDVDSLAREVYARLKTRLRAERDRHQLYR